MRSLKMSVYGAKIVVMLVMCCLVFGSASTQAAAKGREFNPIKSVSLKIGKKKVAKKTYNMRVGEKKKLKVSVSPKKAEPSIRYRSGNRKVAVVNNRGIITAKKTGTTRVKVSVSAKGHKKTAWVKIKVTKEAENKSTQSPAAVTTDSSAAVSAEKDKPVQSPANPPAGSPGTAAGNKSIVVYFSCTDNTKSIAELIQKNANSDIYRIEPEVPYTSADLNYGNTNSRTSKEQNDATARPAIAGTLPDLSSYTVIYLGYPIWWGQAPKIMYTFVEQYNLSGKTIIPFCTSASSGIGTSATNLQAADNNHAVWLAGRRFAGSAQESEVAGWLTGLNLQ